MSVTESYPQLFSTHGLSKQMRNGIKLLANSTLKHRLASRWNSTRSLDVKQIKTELQEMASPTLIDALWILGYPQTFIEGSKLMNQFNNQTNKMIGLLNYKCL